MATKAKRQVPMQALIRTFLFFAFLTIVILGWVAIGTVNTTKNLINYGAEVPNNYQDVFKPDTGIDLKFKSHP
jgi:hypothetical protein